MCQAGASIDAWAQTQKVGDAHNMRMRASFFGFGFFARSSVSIDLVIHVGRKKNR
jgi:hypothetical protein